MAGAWIALVVTAIATYAMFAAGGYTTEALVELPGWGLSVIAAGGALLGLAAAVWGGRSPLPKWVRPLTLGALAGIAIAVVLTHGIACSLGGPSPKRQARYLGAGLVYGVPVGLIVGAVSGLAVSRRKASGKVRFSETLRGNHRAERG